MRWGKNITKAGIGVGIMLMLGVSLYHLPVLGKAYTITSRNGWNADDSLIAQVLPKASYSQVQNIRIEDVTTDDTTIAMSTQSYVAGLYFYLASNYNEDLPFNYLVGWDGSIYEGAKGGLGLQARADSPGTLFIGYLDAGEGLTPAGQSAFSSLLAQLSTKTGVGLDHISSSAYTYSDGAFSTTTASSTWDQQVSGVKSALKGVVADTSKQIAYTVKVNSVSVNAAQDGNNLLVVSMTNTSPYPIYGRVYAGSDTASPLYVQKVWVSNERSNVVVVPDLEPGSETSLTFEIPSALKKGNYSSNLYLDSQKLNGGTIALQVAQDNQTPAVISTTPAPSPTPAGKMITIDNTSTGYLNVHQTPSLSGKIIATVKPGSQFNLVSQSDGWDEIPYDGTSLGWVSAQYVR